LEANKYWDAYETGWLHLRTQIIADHGSGCFAAGGVWMSASFIRTCSAAGGYHRHAGGVI
jgi:hypothetical protein